METLFRPLDFEQALHLLDVLTWFPEAGEERWACAASYVNERCPDSPAQDERALRGVLERVLSHTAAAARRPAGGETGEPAGRWRLIPEPKQLYTLKYDVMAELYPDAWFSCMNMGYAPLAAEAALPPLAASEEPMRHSLHLYHHVAGGVPLAGKRVLEVGCGRGGGADFVARHHGPRELHGLDQCPRNVELCTRRYGRAGLVFHQGDAEALPFAGESFDAVLNVESAHCYPSLARFLAEVRRVLRPGGHFLFADEWWREDLASLRAGLAGSGLVVRREQDVTANVVAALAALERRFPAILSAIADSRQRMIWERFFRVRVCADSAASYTSGRFVFLNFVLERPREAAPGH